MYSLLCIRTPNAYAYYSGYAVVFCLLSFRSPSVINNVQDSHNAIILTFVRILVNKYNETKTIQVNNIMFNFNICVYYIVNGAAKVSLSMRSIIIIYYITHNFLHTIHQFSITWKCNNRH